MRLRTTLLLLLVTGLVAAPAAAATLPYWWFTPAKANRAVVAKNFQLWPAREGQPARHSTILKSVCKGYGLAKRANGLRYYRHFNCTTTWKFDTPDPTYGSGPFKSYLLCDTIKTRPLGLKCQISA